MRTGQLPYSKIPPLDTQSVENNVKSKFTSGDFAVVIVVKIKVAS